MHKFKQNLLAVLNKLGFAAKAKQQDLTAADWDQVRTAYKKEFGTEFQSDQDEYLSDIQQQQLQQQAVADNATAQSILSTVLNEVGSIPVASNTVGSPSFSVIDSAQQAATAIRQMAATAIEDNAPTVGGGSIDPNGPGQSAAHFRGIDHPIFSMNKRHNRVALSPAIAAVEPVDEQSHGELFRADLKSYSGMVASRIDVLRSNKAMNVADLISGVTVSVDPDGLGNQYLTRRVDALIARLAAIKSVYDIFPRRSGVQDREVMINAFFDDFSQAYQEGEIFKGGVELVPEFCYVDDAMLKTRFGSMKNIERQYIGYLNTDGSDPIKWSMIEWVMLQVSQKLVEEQNKRKALGIYVKPTTGEAGHYLNAGTGVIYTLLRYYNECKIARLAQAAYQSYTSGTIMVGVVIAMLDKLKESGVDDLDKYEVILNENHQAMWIKGVRDIYGKDTDFTGPNGNKVPDHMNNIRWFSGLGTLPFVLIQQPNNIQSIEYAPGEMFNIKFDSRMESVTFWSVWKEGTSATYAGRKFDSKSTRAQNGFADQVLFTNFPSKEVAADATAIDVSSDYRLYITSANTQATVITDIEGTKVGAAYQIEIGSEINPSTIAKSGKFANITKAFNPTKVGDYILVIPNADGSKFLELERCEGGARTINSLLQPNVPGGR